MKTNESTSAWRTISPGNLKSFRAGMSVGSPLFISLISGLLNPPGFSIPGMAQAQAIRGEPISALVQTNSVSATNPPAAAKPSFTNGTPTNGIASAEHKSSAAGKPEDFVKAGFDTLSSFRFELTGDLTGPISDPERASQKIRDQIPANVRALSEKQVATQGFMLPLKVKDGLAVDFLLLKNQMACCFGGTPGMNEWIQVRTTGKGVKPVMDQPITVFGTLHVGEVRENGYLSGIYEMDCEKIEAPSWR